MANNQDFFNQVKSLFPGSRTANETAPVEVVSTGLPSMDNIVLGCGGIPRGRSIEIYAPPSIGKTTIALNFCAEYIRQGLVPAWDDREGTLPGSEYTDGMGLDRSQLVIIDSATGNDCLYQARLAIAYDAFDLYVIDSLAAIMPDDASIIDNADNLSMYENQARAKMLTAFYNQIRSGFYIGAPGTAKKDGSFNKGDLIEAAKHYMHGGSVDKYIHKLTDKSTTLLMINHQKVAIGKKFGDKTSTPGGESGKFDASIRLRITRKKKSTKKDKLGTPDYSIIEIRADKNKVAPPFRSALFMLTREGKLMEFDKKAIKKEDLEDENENELEDLKGSGGMKLKPSNDEDDE